MIGKTVSHYRVTAPLGAGGMAIVYLAEDTRLRRKVALKFLPPAIADDRHARSRFEREAQAASALDHPNIATIYEIGEWDGQLFIAMAYYDGETLKQKIERGPLAIGEVASILAQISAGLSAAHAAGIVHRDLKPANIIVTSEGHAKILDFGLAKLAWAGDETRSRMTQAGTTLGTLAYMAPEQLSGTEIDQRSDIWSLGVVLYEMLSRRLPFEAENPAALLYAIVNEPLRPIESLRAEVPPEIARIVSGALRKDSAERMLRASDVSTEIATYQQRIVSGALPAPATVTLSGWLRRRRVLAGATILLGVAAVFAWRAFDRTTRARWAREQALPEIIRLTGEEKFLAAFDLALEAERYIAGDPTLASQWSLIARPLSVTTTPPGAEVYFRDPMGLDPAWRSLGPSPLELERFPRGFFCWRAESQGATPAHDVGPPILGPPTTAPIVLSFALDPVEGTPPGMVRVPSGGSPFSIFIPGLDHLPPVELPDFWMDGHEVTNRQFKQFVDAGGYRIRDYWRHDFVEEGRPLAWESAMSRFHDSTGRPGPAGWELGAYPAGQDDLPVTGVSWYEAGAYSTYAGKALPTIFHWSRVADQRTSGSIVPLSNFGGTGPRRVLESRAMNRHGAFDMAGNVKEWVLNAAGDDKRYILGGAWNEPGYMFTDADARSPFAREGNFGFRCVKLSPDTRLPSNVTAAVLFPSRDFGAEKPVGDDLFAAYRSLYRYDRTDLQPVLESVDDGSPDWRRERVTFSAAYGDERLVGYLFLPKRSRPPFQTIVYFPGSGSLNQRSSEQLESARVEHVVRSGRAVFFPIYKSTYERGDSIKSDYPDRTIVWRDHTIMWSRDLGRSIDYLETRPEIDREKIGYYGFSWGAAMGALLPALEPRLKLAFLIVGGFYLQAALPEADAINFAPRIKIPTLMLNGRYDFFYPIGASQEPMFRLIGTPDEHKRRVVYETGHSIPRNELIKETIDWLDRYFGPPG
jgi:formylglycine-generating enzyme required for sulfatase activity/dienelactone hydrolase/tRNA A-37 threonylcarbamoyl transferase component Bud32